MKLFDKLNLPRNRRFVCAMGSQAGVGKSTILTMLAAELVNEGKRVLYITDDRVSYALTMFKNLIVKTVSKLEIAHKFYQDINFDELLANRNFDYVFLDVYINFTEEKIEKLRDVSLNNNVSILRSYQLHRSPSINMEVLPQAKYQLCYDYVFVVAKRTPSFFDMIKKFLHLKTSNISITSIKSRDGFTKSINTHVDFNRINKK